MIENVLSCAEPGARSKSQRTPLHLACIHRPQHKKGPKNGQLHEGPRFNRALFVTLLAGYGADVEARDNKVGIKGRSYHRLFSLPAGPVHAVADYCTTLCNLHPYLTCLLMNCRRTGLHRAARGLRGGGPAVPGGARGWGGPPLLHDRYGRQRRAPGRHGAAAGRAALPV